MNVSESITNYFYETSWGKCDLFGCFDCVSEECKDITSEDCEKIKPELRFHLRSISTHNSMSKKVHNKANRLLDGLDQFFQSKRVTMIFDERDAKKMQDGDEELNEKCTSPSPLQDSYMEDPNYFDSLVDNVDLSYIESEEEPKSACIKPTVSVTNSWDSFKIDYVDIVKFFESLRDSLPKKGSEVHMEDDGS
ncbi:6310_t:CDS:2 [Diversispora eburnea]|uniref:6310_t:CDS:1 n=1 Tax=Diversispora eburnea TaxID=1213867 RepID=A0A9N9B5R2_9GLOM|nr:6310_t:CDS:2 [Diversispora eburnea]